MRSADKFQGQEAPFVVYSLTTSSAEGTPRGVELLYSLNNLNVATSPTRAIVIVVGSRRLLEPECRSPRQMQLANALCPYVELAAVLETAVQNRADYGSKWVQAAAAAAAYNWHEAGPAKPSLLR